LKQKFFIVLILQFLLQAVLFAAEIPLDYIGQPFYSKNLRVEWKLPTNSLPATVRVFKIVPANFSRRTISNLMNLGGFSEANRTWMGFNGDKLPADILLFTNDNDRHSLGIHSFTTSEGQPDWTVFLNAGSWLTVKRGSVRKMSQRDYGRVV
jgi:hypothetical protein